jgi:AraC family transcriptional regulator
METAIKYIDIPLSDFSPVLISSYLFNPDMSQPRGRKFERRLIEHYEFEFILESHGGMMSNDKEYDLVPNDIVFRRPGQTTQGLPPYKCYAIIFDITGDYEKKDNNDNSKTVVSYKNPVLDLIPLIFNTRYSEKYIPLFNFIMKEHVNPSHTSDIVFKINILQIINMLYYEITNSLEIGSMPMMGQYKYIRKAIEYIKANLNNDINLDELSSNSGLSKNHFLKVFTKALNITPNEYITKIRLEKAKQMLAMTTTPINVISINCGYDNIPYFSYLFKRKIGITPNEFRKKYSYY